MRISPISENRQNPNFEKLVISKKTLKALGCTREDILKNEFIRNWQDSHDIAIYPEGADFTYNIGYDIKKSLFSSKLKFDLPILTGLKFKTLEELNKVVEHAENSFYEIFIFGKYWRTSPTNEYHELRNVAALSNKPKYEKLKKYCVSRLETIPIWMPITDNNLVRDIINNNNIELLKLLISKGANLNEALDMIKNGERVSDEAQELLKGVKRHDEKIFQLEACAGSEYLRNRFLAENPDIDINSRNKNGDTLVTKAFKEGNRRLLEFLLTIDDVNWNAYDKNGQNAAGIILSKGTVFDYADEMGFLMSIPPEKYDINAPSLVYDYGLGKAATPLDQVLFNNQSWLYMLLKNPNVDVMAITLLGRYVVPLQTPIAFSAATRSSLDIERFKDIINHPSFDWSAKVDGKDILTYTQNTKFHSIVKDSAPRYYINELSELYEKDGTLTFEAIETFLKALKSVDGLKQPWINHSINFAHDNIGHLLADINVDIEDFDKMSRLSKILETLKDGGFSFTKPNLLGKTVLDKAIEAENSGLIKLLRESGC